MPCVCQIADHFGERRRVGKVDRGVELECGGRGTPWGVGVGALRVWPEGGQPSRSTRGEGVGGGGCGEVARVHPLSAHSGVRREWWNGGQTRDWFPRGVMMRKPSGWLFKERGLIIGGEAGGQAEMYHTSVL